MAGNGGIPPHSENVEEELQRIQNALKTVFSTTQSSQSSDPAFHQHDLANRYLISFQCLPIAWMVCDKLLLQENDDCNSFFFAAQTLHFKCREEVYIAQLPPNSLTSLRDSLMSHLSRFAINPPSAALITRLCMAIASLSVQMHWTTIVTDLLDNVKARPELGPAILELIQLIPEETCSDRLYLPDEKMRFDFRESLRGCSQLTLDFLVQVMNVPNTNITHQERILKCFHLWVRNVDIPPTLLQNTPLLDASFQVLANPDSPIFESAVDVVVEILRQYGSEPTSHAGLVQKMIPLVMQLGKTVFPSVLSAQDENEDALRGYCRIFTELGESYMSLIMSPEEMNQIELVDLILRCSAIPEHEIANITLNFWYHFVTSLENIQSYGYRQQKIDYFTPILLKFLQVCVTLLKYPEDLEDLHIDQVDDVERDRRFVAESVEDCCRLLGGNMVLDNIGNRIQQEAVNFQSLPPLGQTKNWQGVEASLYSLQAIANYIPSDEDKVLPFVMELFGALPRTIMKISLIINITIGNYATWLGRHAEYLNALLPFLSEGLNTPGCASSSAIAIKKICKSCTQQPLGDAVLQLYEGIVEASNNFNISGGSLMVDLRDELQVLEGACLAITRQLESNPGAVTMYMNRIVNPIITRLTSLATPEIQCNAKQVVAEIERLVVIVRFLDPPFTSAEEKYDDEGDEQSARYTFIIPLMSQSWNLLEAVANKFPTDPNVAEKLCRLHKHAIRGCGKHYVTQLEPLMTTLVRNFQQSFLSPYLYAASICITEFSHMSDLLPGLYQMISHLSTAVFAKLKTLDDFTAHPDVVEEFFYLLGRCMSYCPNTIVTSPLLNSFLQCAVVGMHVQHKDSNKGTLTFLEHTISYGITLTYNTDLSDPESGPTSQMCKGALEKAIMNEGQAIVTNLAKALLGELPLYSHSLDRGSASIAGIIYQMNDLCPELLLQWMSEALQNAPDPAKTEFLTALVQRVSTDDYIRKLKNLNDLCERNRKVLQKAGL